MKIMRSLFRPAGFASLVVAAAFSWSASALAEGPPPSPGKYMAVASDCFACHTAPGGKPFAGGLPIDAPMGKIYATNITPSRQYGIGDYTEADFARVLRKGVRRDGSNLYPAMPYTSYALMTDEDIHQLYLYFTKEVAAVDAPVKKTDLPFPYNIRLSMAVWNMMFLNNKPFQPDPAQSAAWNRGAYLVEGAAHCSVCHSPRGFMMQELSDKRYAGALIGAWYAPNITSDPTSGVGQMSIQEISDYLKSGKVHGKAQAAGDMATAVQDSFRFLTDADITAMATYVKSIKPVKTSDRAKSRFEFGGPATEAASIRGVGGVKSDNHDGDGPALFLANCGACHGVSGQGTRDGYYPSLYHNSALVADGGRNLVATILNGVNRETAQGLAFMPGFGGKANDIAALSDDQIVKIANYALKVYGDPEAKVTSSLVADVRKGVGPTPPLVILVDIGKWVAGILLGVFILGMFYRGSRKARA